MSQGSISTREEDGDSNGHEFTLDLLKPTLGRFTNDFGKFLTWGQGGGIGKGGHGWIGASLRAEKEYQ